MAFDYNKAFKRIIAKATVLEERYHQLLVSRNEAMALAETLKAEVKEKDKEIQRLRTQVEYLQMANTIAPSREQIEAARAMITGLVRDIDRCIIDLTD